MRRESQKYQFINIENNLIKKVKRKVQGVSQSQVAAKRKRKETQTVTRQTNKYTKSTQTNSLFPKRGDHDDTKKEKKTAKRKNKTHGKTEYKSPRRIHHKDIQSINDTRITALERSEEETTADFKAFLHLTNFNLGPDAPLNTEIH